MKISRLELKNFRCFEDFTLELDERINLIVGKNTSGKTSALEGLTVAIGGYLLGIPNSFAGVTKKAHIRNLDDADVRRFFSKGKEIVQTEFSDFTSVKAFGVVDNKDLIWERYSKGIGSRTNNSGCNKLKHVADEAYKKSVDSDGYTLPVLVHYGTGRLWAGQKADIKKLAGTNTALGYYYALKPDAQNKILMSWIQKMFEVSFEKGRILNVLQCVLNTIEKFIPDCTGCYYSRDYSELALSFNNGDEFPYSLLSDGQRNIVALVGDIAMRCAHLNQHLGLEATLQTPGIVLVDEIDTNIHPEWQKIIIPQLREYFPNIQFIITSHSPFIIQSIKDGRIFDLEVGPDYYPLPTWKKSIEDVASDVMHVEEVTRSNCQVPDD